MVGTVSLQQSPYRQLSIGGLLWNVGRNGAPLVERVRWAHPVEGLERDTEREEGSQ